MSESEAGKELSKGNCMSQSTDSLLTMEGGDTPGTKQTQMQLEVQHSMWHAYILLHMNTQNVQY